MISGIATTKTGIEISFINSPKTSFTNASIVSDKLFNQGSYDIYFHKYTNSAMKNPNRIATLLVNAGAKIEENWWIIPAPKEDLKHG